jgi:hypothetical protein
MEGFDPKRPDVAAANSNPITESLNIATYNIKGLPYNELCLHTLLNHHDILFLQEHWLHSYEIQEITTHLHSCGFNSQFKTFDAECPVDHSVRTRGQAGVGIVWKESLNDIFKPLPNEGSDRIICALLHTTPPTLCVAVYMPSDGVNTVTDYQDVLDQISEIIIKYKQYQLLLTGDFNASLHRPNRRQFDIPLQSFLREHGIVLPEEYPTTKTYSLYRSKKGDNGIVDDKELLESLIDYMFCKPTSLLHSVSVLGEEAKEVFTCNGSDHHPVRATLSYTRATNNVKSKQRRKDKEPIHFACWDKIDIDLYKSTVDTELQHIKGQSPQEELESLTAILLASSDKAVPTKTIYPNRKHKLPREALALHDDCKRFFWLWKMEGKDKCDPLYAKIQDLKRQMRQQQRQGTAQTRRNFYQEITDNKNNAKIFHKLVNRQRKQKSCATEKLVIDNISKESDEEIRDAWATYFEQLSTPGNKEHFDNATLQDIQQDIHYIRQSPPHAIIDMAEITTDEIRTAINRLNNNKAPDLWGLRAEHLKLAAEEIIPIIVPVFNQIIHSGKIPEIFKKGYLTPVLKKGKPKEDPNGYRGIVVCSVLGKILEISLVSRLAIYFDQVQSQLQCGFTEKTSYLNAALITQEAINDSLENNIPVTQILLDAEKAFDVVWHDGLLKRMHNLGIPHSLWLLFCDWYDGLSAVVKWKGKLSSEFPLQQGTGQGRIFSTTNYKIFNNDLLLRMEQAGLGIHIGDIPVGSPTCADDVTILADSRGTDPQTMTSSVELYANESRYTIGMKKTQMVQYAPKSARDITPSVTYNEEPIASTDSAIQLGIIQNSGKKANTMRISENVQTARKTTYALFSSGLHGTNGISPAISKSIWTLHILPRLVHGLEICKITDKEVAPAEIFCRDICKQLLGLPRTAPTPAVYFLFGILPVQAEIHRRAINLFHSIASKPTSREHHIALRQLTHKSLNSNSWFTYIHNILRIYNLPSAHEILANPLGKANWKYLVKNTIVTHWETSLRKETMAYKSLKYLSLASMVGAQTPAVWTSASHSVFETAKAAVKCKLLAGTYPLQNTHRKFNQHAVDSTCLLCETGEEDVIHFLTSCEKLQELRDLHLPRLCEAIKGWDPTHRILLDSTTIVQLLLDCSTIISHSGSPDIVREVEKISRDYIYAIHCQRQQQLQPSTTDAKYSRLCKSQNVRGGNT